MVFGTDFKLPHPLRVFEASDIEVILREFGSSILVGKSSRLVGRRIIELNLEMEIVVGVNFSMHIRPLS